MRQLTIDGDDLDRLAAGDGGIDGALRAGQRSKRLLLLRELMNEAQARSARTFVEADAAGSFAVLAAARRRDRGAVDAVLMQPHVGAWATRCLRRLDAHGEVAAEDMGHLGSVAAAAAARAGGAFDVTAYAREGSVPLPTLGEVRVPGLTGWCHVHRGSDDAEITVTGRDARHAIDVEVGIDVAGSAETDHWRPLRHLRVAADGVVLDVGVEDLDPYRDCGHLPAGCRLDTGEVGEWQASLDAAWPLLVAEDRGRAEALAAGIASIVPLRSTTATMELSASCHEAVGAIAMTRPAKPLGMALALVHELQHNKLSALLDVVPLIENGPEVWSYAPWRSDPRPLRGLLQGTYAFLGLARFWASIRDDCAAWDPGTAVAWAHFEFALGRRQVATAVRTLLGSAVATPPGERFVAGMGEELDRLSRLEVLPLAETFALLARRDHTRSWRLRNLRPDADVIDGWAADWRRGRRCTWPGIPKTAVLDGGGPIASATRHSLIRHRLAFENWHELVDGASAADLEVVSGRYVDAGELYEKQIEQDPDDIASWAGLALVGGEASTPAGRVLAEHPEIVLALHRAVRQAGEGAPSAGELAEWLGRGAAAPG